MANTFTNLLYHVVFSTKGREPLIRDNWRDELYAYVGGVVRNERGTLIQAGGTADHVHLLMKLPASAAIADMLRLVKANSSKWANESAFSRGAFAWQTGYAAFSVSESNAPAVGRYIRNQVEHHRGLSFQEEFVALLQRHGVAYDPRYLWR
ncbi:MAG TPA: IS200/IS605 family transposase [Pirellulales bacterium]|nr:IS200/IS605 family transposase [Pirellulales bacterium]